jgi:hypothetical protein
MRGVSNRPTLLVDDRSGSIGQPYTGIPGPLGRRRVVTALPLKNGPRTLKPPQLVHDDNSGYLADPGGVLIGMAQICVHRLVVATKAEDTRRL